MKILNMVIVFLMIGNFTIAQKGDSLVAKNKESIILLKDKIARLESGVTPNKSTLTIKEIIELKDSIVYLTKELEVCSATNTSLKSVEKLSNKTVKVTASYSLSILFASDIYKLTLASKELLKGYVTNLPSEYSFIVIKGHADQRGATAINEEVSRKRAIAIKYYLIQELNISPQKIVMNWFGSSLPSQSESNDKRCELSVIL